MVWNHGDLFIKTQFSLATSKAQFSLTTSKTQFSLATSKAQFLLAISKAQANYLALFCQKTETNYLALFCQKPKVINTWQYYIINVLLSAQVLFLASHHFKKKIYIYISKITLQKYYILLKSPKLIIFGKTFFFFWQTHYTWSPKLINFGKLIFLNKYIS